MNHPINAAAEHLNATIEHLEDWLRSKNLSVAAEVKFEENVILSFGKDGKDWRLLLTFADGSDRRPLLNASRRQRVAAIYFVPALLAKMRLQADSRHQELLNAITFANDLMDGEP